VAFEACGATPNDAGIGVSANPTTGNPVSVCRSLVFPAPSAAFDHRWSGALEDVTGGSLPSGEPLFIGTP
jgi:hypothetical protein